MSKLRLPDAVGAFLKAHEMHDMHITAALSGGADSVCLLYCLLYYRETFSLKIAAMHIQHGLRGEESIRDEIFCRQLCQKLNIPLQVIPVDIPAYREKKHCSVETAARECRYQAFAEHADGWIATAHTATDNLETILFRLIRGTGLKGLVGIPPVREKYIRPLLYVSRHEIEAYLHKQKIEYIIDSSNLSDDYARNRIRHHIRPWIDKLTANAEKSVMMMTDILGQEEDFLMQSAQNAYQTVKQPDNSLKNLHVLHPALQRRCIALYLQEADIQPDYQKILRIQKLLAHGGHTEIVRGKITAHVSRHIFYLQTEKQSIPEKILCMGDNQIYADCLLRAEQIPAESYSPAFQKYALDYDAVCQPVRLHGRKNALYLKMQTHTVSVKKWLQTQPPVERQYLHYLSDENGLLWVQGLGAASRAAVTEQTKIIVLLSVHMTDTECT